MHKALYTGEVCVGHNHTLRYFHHPKRPDEIWFPAIDVLKVLGQPAHSAHAVTRKIPETNRKVLLVRDVPTITVDTVGLFELISRSNAKRGPVVRRWARAWLKGLLGGSKL